MSQSLHGLLHVRLQAIASCLRRVAVDMSESTRMANARSAGVACRLVWLLSLSSAISVCADDIKVSVPEIPPLVQSTRGGQIVDLVHALSSHYGGGRFLIEGPYPFKRSIDNVASGKSDMHIPLLFNPAAPNPPPGCIYSTESMFHVVFVLYVRNDHPIRSLSSLSNLKLEGFSIETDAAHIHLFPFPLEPAVSIESALRKVEAGRIDGFLFAMKETDAVLRRLAFQDIRRIEYGSFDARAIFPDTPKGRRHEAIYSQLLKDCNASGECPRLLGDLAHERFVESIW